VFVRFKAVVRAGGTSVLAEESLALHKGGKVSDRMQELVDANDVIGVVTALFVATDRRDWDTVLACLAPEVNFDMTSLTRGESGLVPAGQIVTNWQQGLAPIDAVHHQVGNFRVALNGDRAAVSCYGIAYHFRAKATGGTTRVFVGSYDVGLQRQDSGWRIDEFRFNCRFIDGNLTLEHA
jgi:hypothetical protein